MLYLEFQVTERHTKARNPFLVHFYQRPGRTRIKIKSRAKSLQIGDVRKRDGRGKWKCSAPFLSQREAKAATAPEERCPPPQLPRSRAWTSHGPLLAEDAKLSPCAGFGKRHKPQLKTLRKVWLQTSPFNGRSWRARDPWEI